MQTIECYECGATLEYEGVLPKETAEYRDWLILVLPDETTALCPSCWHEATAPRVRELEAKEAKA